MHLNTASDGRSFNTFYNNPINVYLFEEIYGGYQKSCCRKVSETVFRLFFMGVTLGGGIAYVPISVKGGGSNKKFAYTLAASNLVGYQLFINHAMFPVITAVMKPGNKAHAKYYEHLAQTWLQADQHALQQMAAYYRSSAQKSSGRRHLTMMLAALSVGIVATVPIGYAAYEYNRHEHGKTAAYLFFTANMGSDVWVPARSMILTQVKIYAQGIKSYIRPTQLEKNLHKAKNNLLECIETQLDNISFLCSQGVSEHTRKTYLNAFCCDRNMKGLPPQFITSLAQSPHLKKETWSRLKSNAEKVGQLIGSLLSLSVIFFFSCLAYPAMGSLWKQPAAQYSVAVLTGLASTYIYMMHIANIVGAACRKLACCATCSDPRTATQKLRGKVIIPLQMATIISTSFSWGVVKQLSEDLYAGWSKEFVTYMQITAGAATALMLTSSALKTLNAFIELAIIKRGKPQERDLMRLHRVLRNLRQCIHNASLVDIARFLLAAPQETSQKIAQGTSITPEVLSRYISSRDSSSPASTGLGMPSLSR